jgi:MoaA/NifB/PqqE/SkfB family radical SAM enzyme
MYQYQDIRHVHLEISSRCNAACPLCPRNFYGYEFNDGFVEHDMTLNEAQAIFTVDFLQQLEAIAINGNFGDIVMNSDAVDIIEYFRSTNPKLKITISTNGSARNQLFWQSLARLDCEVVFCIDGLEDTHHLYRQNTSYTQIIKNAQTFINAGGTAVWKMIEFDHNVNQRNIAKTLATEMGFKKFLLVNDKRNTGPVFDKNQKLTHILGTPEATEFKVLFHKRTTDNVLLEDITVDKTPKPINCTVKRNKSIYISSLGDVYPCCFLGFEPNTYGHGIYHEAANKQVQSLINQNSALKYGVKNAMQWFNNVENSWSVPTFAQGRLVICNDVCGN